MNFSLTDIIMVIVVYSITFLIVGTLRFVGSRRRLSPMMIRDAIHIACGGTILLLPLFSDWFYPFLLPLGMAILILFGPSARRDEDIESPVVHGIDYSQAHSLGPLYYMISTAILIPLAWSKMTVVMAAVMIMAWGDGAASLVAPRIKRRHNYPFGGKSIEGSLLVFLLGFAGAIVAWTVGSLAGVSNVPTVRIVSVSFLGALAGCVAEAASIGPLRPFDNFTVPFSSALLMYLASS